METMQDGAAFDPETIELLKNILEDAWASLPSPQQQHTSRTEMAARILRLAGTGERDPVRLKACALMSVVHTA